MTTLNVILFSVLTLLTACSQPITCGEFALGESFPSDDGCNTCSCTENGIACTERACIECTSDNDCGEIKVCPDGTEYRDVKCIANSCEQMIFTGGSPCFDESAPQ